ncbi:DUF6701 domain-containing protein [Thiohalophilus thiocyanatoxydans]|nr:DUF6701 domain-containing protein [Thiohalophilus thiocyanatoxydans]
MAQYPDARAPFGLAGRESRLADTLASLRRGWRKTARIAGALLVGALLLAPAPSANAYPADQCAADRFGSDLNCTANDVAITNMQVIGDMTWCEGGTDIVVDLEVTVNFASPDRNDIGVFISNDGNDPQTTEANGGAASCSVSELPTESPFLDLDGDSCGDGNQSISGGTGSGTFYMTDVTVPCQAMPGSGNDLYVPFVVSWDQDKQGQNVCSDERDPVPRTKSKCNAPDIAQGTIQVGVMPSISKSDDIEYIKSGDSTTYDVTITNDTGDELGGAEFSDPAVSDMSVDSLNCTASGGATCPTGYTIADMQGDGITLPDMPDGGSLTFEIEATLTGDPNDTITNTGYVTMGSHTNSASDTNTIVDEIGISPTSQNKEGAAGNTVTYEYTVNNFTPWEDDISLSAVSSEGWNVLLSDATLTVDSEGSADFTLEVEIPAGASIDDFDTTTITATSGDDPTMTASATAKTTVAELLTLVPDNTAAGGPGQTFSYEHTLQNNFSSSQTISLSTAMTGDCTDWQATIYEADGETVISSVDLDGNGDNTDIVVEVTAPNSAAIGDSCVVTTTGTTSGVSASAKDTTTIKELGLFWDPDYEEESYIYPAGNNVYGKAFGLTDGEDYYFEWYDPAGDLVRTSSTTTVLGTVLPDTYKLPDDATLGTWNVKVWHDTTPDRELHQETDFYVGPDHIEASHSGDTETTDTNVEVDLALHDRFNHAIPEDSNGDLITANPPTTANPLLVTVTVDGSASIVSTSLGNATISGQKVTGLLDDTDGTATMTITNSVAETVNVTPESHEPALYGSPLRDESAAIDFKRPPLDHFRLEYNGQGLTCQPKSITVKACIDTNCNNLYAYDVSVSLSPGGWVGGDNKVLSGGSEEFELRKTTTGTVTLDIDSSSPSPNNTPVCVNTATDNESCDLTFHDSGFLVDVPTQTSCQTSGDLTLSAVRTDDVTQKCVPAFASTTKNLKIWAEYSDPASGTQSVELSHAGNDYSLPDTEPGATNIPIEFNADAEATYNLTYPDAGRLVLKTQYEGSGDDAGLTMLGDSTYVTKPAKLYVHSDDTDADCASGDATCSRLTAAGDSFNMKVRGACADNSLTPNFRLDNIDLTQNLVAPAGGESGSINVTNFNIADEDNGEHLINNQTVSEVGVFTFTASLGSGVDYFGETSIGNTTLNTSDNIGRFSPHHFVVNATEACNDSFTYSGQPFTVTAEARNQGDNPTRNYRDGFVRDPVISNAGDTDNFSNNTLGSSEFTTNDGIGERTDITYTFPDKKTAPLNITELRATDSDGITSDTYTEGEINIRSGRIALDNAYGSELVDLRVPMVAQYYDGDAFVRNEEDICDNGVTISLLNPTDTLEVGDGETRGETCVQDTDDSGDSGAGCAIAADTDIQYTDAPPDAGEYTLYLKAPDDDSSFDPDDPIYGTLTVRADAPAYLQYDWDDDATEEEPAATISFGRYRGDDRVIYWREKF